jgi:hypothetical protein
MIGDQTGRDPKNPNKPKNYFPKIHKLASAKFIGYTWTIDRSVEGVTQERTLNGILSWALIYLLCSDHELRARCR